jgi:hypothetical protein
MLFPEFDTEEWADLYSDPDSGRVSIRMAATLLGVSVNLLQGQMIHNRRAGDEPLSLYLPDEPAKARKISAKRPPKPIRLP